MSLADVLFGNKDFILYLEENGDCIEVKNCKDKALPEVLENAQDCKTHIAVLNFLQKIKSSDCEDSIFFAYINPHPIFRNYFAEEKPLFNKSTLDELIQFVSSKILEQKKSFCTLL